MDKYCVKCGARLNETTGMCPNCDAEKIKRRKHTGRQKICRFLKNQRIIAGNAQFAGIAAGRGVRFTTGLLLLGKGLGMRETPIRPHSWH